MDYIWHGHSCFELVFENGYRIIIDPFITGNPLCPTDVQAIQVDAILLTHAHDDHIGDTEIIATQNQAQIIAIVEVADFFTDRGYDCIGMNLGGTHNFPFGSVKMIPALHSSSYEGKTMGVAAGYLIDDGITRFYHAGDTALFSDMALVGSVDIACLPIGDHFTMGIQDATLATTIITSQCFIPMHYNTFPLIKQDPELFKKACYPQSVFIPKIGQQYQVKAT